MADVTQILSKVEAVHPQAAEQLLELVYDELLEIDEALQLLAVDNSECEFNCT